MTFLSFVNSYVRPLLQRFSTLATYSAFKLSSFPSTLTYMNTHHFLSSPFECYNKITSPTMDNNIPLVLKCYPILSYWTRWTPTSVSLMATPSLPLLIIHKLRYILLLVDSILVPHRRIFYPLRGLVSTVAIYLIYNLLPLPVGQPCCCLRWLGTSNL